MKKILMTSALVLGLVTLSSAADAGHHKGKDGKKAHGIQRMMDKHDLNGDGVITKNEALKAAEDRFTKMDANSDGEVTIEEGEAYYKAKHAANKKARQDAEEAPAKADPVEKSDESETDAEEKPKTE